MTTLSTDLRNAKANQLSAQLGTGAKLLIKEGATTIVVFALADPALGAASNGSATLSGVPLTANAVAATVDNTTALTAEFQTSGGDVKLTETVGVTGGNQSILLNTTTDTNGHPAIALNQPCRVDSYTYTQPAS